MRLLIVGVVVLAHVYCGSSQPTRSPLNDQPARNDLLSVMLHSNNTRALVAEHFWDIIKIKSLVKELSDSSFSYSKCLACKVGVAFLQQYVRHGATEDQLGDFALQVCNFFRIETPRVCAGVAKLFKRELTQVLAAVALEPSEACGLFYSGCGFPINPLHNWTVPSTPFPKPTPVPPRPPKAGAPVSRVLHISDVHIDPYYMTGGHADCGEPLCCREPSPDPQKASGPWGDYRNCDIPLRTLENMLRHINKTHKIDYVMWTGDIPPHDIWNNSRSEVTSLLHTVSKVVDKYLGKVPIFPALGNHESAPVNSFPIPSVKGNDSVSWLYNEVERAWVRWLPHSSATLKLGAYYSVPVNPGLRIISMNMNYCNKLNWWLLMNSTDPTDQLAWLVTQLQMAEDKNEKVHLIGHIPPGETTCLGVWSTNFYKIINRYESTITAQFYGHTHADEFEIFYDKSGPKPRATSIAYVGPSVTTYEGVNPGYRIYTIDGNYPESSRVVLDHETYIVNLTEANLYGDLKWRLEYSARKEYNMTSLLPAEWHRLTQRFEEDDTLFQKFYRLFFKLSDFDHGPCDADCRKTYVCRVRRGQSNDPLVC